MTVRRNTEAHPGTPMKALTEEQGFGDLESYPDAKPPPGFSAAGLPLRLDDLQSADHAPVEHRKLSGLIYSPTLGLANQLLQRMRVLPFWGVRRMNKRGNAKAHTGSSMKTLTAEQRFDDLKSLLDANAPPGFAASGLPQQLDDLQSADNATAGQQRLSALTKVQALEQAKQKLQHRGIRPSKESAV